MSLLKSYFFKKKMFIYLLLPIIFKLITFLNDNIHFKFNIPKWYIFWNMYL